MKEYQFELFFRLGHFTVATPVTHQFTVQPYLVVVDATIFTNQS